MRRVPSLTLPRAWCAYKVGLELTDYILDLWNPNFKLDQGGGDEPPADSQHSSDPKGSRGSRGSTTSTSRPSTIRDVGTEALRHAASRTGKANFKKAWVPIDLNECLPVKDGWFIRLAFVGAISLEGTLVDRNLRQYANKVEIGK
eukprot:8643451-Pyramimonas_sp.AAC.1